MPFRSVLLRVLFWSLALAAVFEALGTLFASHEALWRVAGTSIATAVSALLLLAASSKMDKPAPRPAAVLAITLVVIEFLLTLTAIWEMGMFFGGRRHEDSLWLTVLFIALTGVPAIAFLRMAATSFSSLAGRVGLLLAAVELVMLLILAWNHSLWSQDETIAELAGSFPLFALLAIICLVGRGADPPRTWRWIGVVAAALAYGITAYGIINHIQRGGDVVIYITCLGAAIAHANIVLLCPLRQTQMWLRWLTIASGVATTFFVALTTHLGENGDGMTARLAGACGIVAGCGTLALAILARLNRRVVVTPEAMSGLSEITLICPVCQKKQTLPLGDAACAECRVLIHVRVEEPQCTRCGYSLLMLRSNACPECGAPVPSGLSPAGPSGEPAIPI